MPDAFVKDYAAHGARLFAQHVDQDRHEGYRIAGLQPPEEGLFHQINPCEETAPDAGISQQKAHVAELIPVVEADIGRFSSTAQGQGDFPPLGLMGRNQPFQGKIRQDVAIVHQHPVIINQKVFDIFQPAAGIEKERLIAEGDGDAPPLAVGKGFRVAVRAVVGVDDKAPDADGAEVIQGIGDQRTAPDGQQGLGAGFRQGTQAGPQSRARTKAVLT